MEHWKVKETIVAVSAAGATAMATPPPINLMEHPAVLLWWMGILTTLLGGAVVALLWAGRRYITGKDKIDTDQWAEISNAKASASSAKDKAYEALDITHQLWAEHNIRKESPFCMASNPDRLEVVVEKAVIAALNKSKYHHARRDDRLTAEEGKG